MFCRSRHLMAPTMATAGALQYKSCGNEATNWTCHSSRRCAPTQLCTQHNLTHRLLLQNYLQEQWRRGAKAKTQHHCTTPLLLHQEPNTTQQLPRNERQHQLPQNTTPGSSTSTMMMHDSPF